MSESDSSEPVYRTVEQLLAEGGQFYLLDGQPWCDTPFDSWYLVPGKGYIRMESAE